MYKLFLWLKYLRRRYLAWLSALAVALCVFMMLTSISVMDGFLAKAEVAAKGLFGDIIIDPASITGIGRYDEFISRLTGEYRVDGDFQVAGFGSTDVDFEADAKYVHIEALVGTSTVAAVKYFPGRGLLYENDRFLCELHGELRLTPDGKVGFLAPVDPPPKGSTFEDLKLKAVYAKVGDGLPEVEAATPVINSYGLLRAGEGYSTTIQISGIRMPERTRVTSFEKGLFVQADDHNAGFTPPMRQVLDKSLEHVEMIDRVFQAEEAKPEDDQDAMLLLRLSRARDNVPLAMRLILLARAKLAAERAKGDDVRSDVAIDQLARRIELETDALAEGFARNFAPPSNRVILGLGIGGLSFRIGSGEHVRSITPGTEVVLTLLPVGRRGRMRKVNPNTATFHVVDDAKTDVHSIDSRTVYIPFEKLQLMADMFERRDMNNPALADPARCSQIQIKVRGEFAAPAKLVVVRRKIEREWLAFYPKYEREFDLADINTDVRVQTWYERLSDFIGPIQKQRTLVALMFGVISFVAVLLIFAIFYMIVMQKVRDIGVVRAVGGSAAGVAQIFLAFGAATGLAGSFLGVLGGCAFVWNINEIHDWLGRTVGFQVWTPETYLFDEIPNQVDPAVVVAIVLWAVFSGLVGALIPAVRAAVMEPAEAVRYG